MHHSDVHEHVRGKAPGFRPAMWIVYEEAGSWATGRVTDLVHVLDVLTGRQWEVVIKSNKEISNYSTHFKCNTSTTKAITSRIENTIMVNGGGQKVMERSYWPSGV